MSTLPYMLVSSNVTYSDKYCHFSCSDQHVASGAFFSLPSIVWSSKIIIIRRSTQTNILILESSWVNCDFTSLPDCWNLFLKNDKLLMHSKSCKCIVLTVSVIGLLALKIKIRNSELRRLKHQPYKTSSVTNQILIRKRCYSKRHQRIYIKNKKQKQNSITFSL